LRVAAEIKRDIATFLVFQVSIRQEADIITISENGLIIGKPQDKFIGRLVFIQQNTSQ